MKPAACLRQLLLTLTFGLATAATAAGAEAEPAMGSALPDTGAALARVAGSLLIVFAILFAGVWLVKNWRRLAPRNGRLPRLRLLETQPLGGRQGLHVVCFDRQRFLISAGPTGVNLLSELPELEPAEQEEQQHAVAAPSAFARALQQMMTRTP